MVHRWHTNCVRVVQGPGRGSDGLSGGSDMPGRSARGRRRAPCIATAGVGHDWQACMRWCIDGASMAHKLRAGGARPWAGVGWLVRGLGHAGAVWHARTRTHARTQARAHTHPFFIIMSLCFSLRLHFSIPPPSHTHTHTFFIRLMLCSPRRLHSSTRTRDGCQRLLRASPCGPRPMPSAASATPAAGPYLQASRDAAAARQNGPAGTGRRWRRRPLARP